MRCAIVVAWCVALTSSAFADDHDPLAADALRRNTELVKQGFNFTHRVTADVAATVEWIVQPSPDPVEIAVWFETARGSLAVRIVGPKGEVLEHWDAGSGSSHISRALPPGRYVVEVKPTGGALAQGVVGVKGPILGVCSLDPRATEHAADPAHGFSWPYLLLAPKPEASSATLLVVPNNTGFATDDLGLIRTSAACQLASVLELADRLGTPVLVPMFPRPPAKADDLYVQALSRDTLMTRTTALARVDLQLVAMIDDARAKSGGVIRPRVLIEGFSAAGMFTNRFALLHPDRTLAAAVGSPGGWPIAPLVSDGGEALPYPIGIADVEALTKQPIDLTALQRVAFVFFLGEDDHNDSVVFRDSFSTTDEALVMRRFGKTPAERWAAAERLYHHAKLHATFKLYPGVGHEVTAAMRAEIEATFRAALADP